VESPENTERLRVKPAMTAQSKKHRKPTVCDAKGCFIFLPSEAMTACRLYLNHDFHKI
jgi:hypothetical protein